MPRSTEAIGEETLAECWKPASGLQLFVPSRIAYYIVSRLAPTLFLKLAGVVGAVVVGGGGVIFALGSRQEHCQESCRMFFGLTLLFFSLMFSHVRRASKG